MIISALINLDMMATEAGVGLGTALRSSLRGDSRTLLLSKPSEVASHAPPLGWELNLGANLQKRLTRRIWDRLINYVRFRCKMAGTIFHHDQSDVGLERV